MAGRRRLARSNGRQRYGSSDFAALGLRQSDAQCGPQAGRCPGDLCCSSYGFCGDSVDHCHPLFDCQTQYGTCGWPRVAPQPSTTSTPAPPTSTSTTPRPPTSTPATTSRIISTPTSTIPIPTGDLQVTTNGMCGNNTMCIGNPNYGPCCSQFFWCGSSIDFCGAGCRSEFGACLGIPGQPGNPPTNGTITTPGGPILTPPAPTTSTTTRVSTTSTTPAAPSFTLPAGQRSSTDGRCGNNVNCLGSNFGRCCSQFGYCGDGDQYCPYIVGCQPQFGYCDPQ